MEMPDDPEENVYLKIWLFHGWAIKIETYNQTMRNHAILIGSFFNPEEARKLSKKDNPDYETSEDDFEGSWAEVLKSRKRQGIDELMRPPSRRLRRARQVLSA